MLRPTRCSVQYISEQVLAFFDPHIKVYCDRLLNQGSRIPGPRTRTGPQVICYQAAMGHNEKYTSF